MSYLTSGFAPHYCLDEIAVEIWIHNHQSRCKSDAMLFCSLSFSYMLDGAWLPPEPGSSFPQNCACRDGTNAVLTDSHSMLVLLCNRDVLWVTWLEATLSQTMLSSLRKDKTWTPAVLVISTEIFNCKCVYKSLIKRVEWYFPHLNWLWCHSI